MTKLSYNRIYLMH